MKKKQKRLKKTKVLEQVSKELESAINPTIKILVKDSKKNKDKAEEVIGHGTFVETEPGGRQVVCADYHRLAKGVMYMERSPSSSTWFCNTKAEEPRSDQQEKLVYTYLEYI